VPWWLLSRRRRRDRRKERAWRAAGRPLPAPSVVKRGVIREYADRYGMQTLIETGTYKGGTIDALNARFERIYSIELDDALYARARARFAAVPHVIIVHGDSADVLPRLLRTLDGPSLFWLDGHYSGGDTAKGGRETPIMEEIQAILAHPVRDHIILIDDARAFGTWPDYPTLEQFEKLIATTAPNLAFTLKDDIIRVTPKK